MSILFEEANDARVRNVWFVKEMDVDSSRSRRFGPRRDGVKIAGNNAPRNCIRRKKF